MTYKNKIFDRNIFTLNSFNESFKVQSLELKNQNEEFQSNLLKITISGAGRTVCPDLVAQLATLQNLNKNGVSINLYDSPGHFFKIKDIGKDAKGIGGKLSSIKIINSLSDGLKNCDLLIYLDHSQRFAVQNYFNIRV